jgi:hypothetical protein
VPEVSFSVSAMDLVKMIEVYQSGERMKSEEEC